MALERVRNYIPRLRMPSWAEIKDGSFLRRGEDQQVNQSETFLKNFENWLVWGQEVCVWTHPTRTAIVAVLSQYVLYHLTYSSSTLVNLAAWTAMVAYIYHTWVYALWPAIRVPPPHPQDDEAWTPVHPDVLSAPELAHYLHNFQLNRCKIQLDLVEYRSNHPGKFCLASSSIFLTLALVGRYVSTLAFLHVASLLLILLPGLYLRLSRHPATQGGVEKITSCLGTVWALAHSPEQPSGEDHLEEFLPEENNENENIMERALVQQDIVHQDDSLTISLVTGLSDMPDHDDIEMDSLKAIEVMEEDLAPVLEDEDSSHMNDSDTESYSEERLDGRIKGVEESDSDSLELDILEPGKRKTKERLSFKSQHYDELSSSEEDDLMPTSSLMLSPSSAAQEPDSLLSTVTGSLPFVSSVLPSVSSYLPSVGAMSGLLSNLLPSADRHEADLEDFELISEDELENETKRTT